MGAENTPLLSCDQICNKYFRADGSWRLYDCVLEWRYPQTEDARAGLDEEMLPDDWQTVGGLLYLIPIFTFSIIPTSNSLLIYQMQLHFRNIELHRVEIINDNRLKCHLVPQIWIKQILPRFCCAVLSDLLTTSVASHVYVIATWRCNENWGTSIHDSFQVSRDLDAVYVHWDCCDVWRCCAPISAFAMNHINH